MSQNRADQKLRVLMTGAAGTVGTVLWSAWEAENRYQLTLVDLREIEGATSTCNQGDIRDCDQMKTLCQNQDVLVHLISKS